MITKINGEVVDFEKELKRRQRNEKLKQAWDTTATFVRDNQDVLLFTVPAAVTVIGGGSRLISKMIAKNMQERDIRFKETTIYDRSLGRYVTLKRPLKASESLEIERRRGNGEKLHAILNDMKLLKR